MAAAWELRLSHPLWPGHAIWLPPSTSPCSFHLAGTPCSLTPCLKTESTVSVQVMIELLTYLWKEPFWRRVPSISAHEPHASSLYFLSGVLFLQHLPLLCLGSSHDLLPLNRIIVVNEWVIAWVNELAAYSSFLWNPDVLNFLNLFIFS